MGKDATMLMPRKSELLLLLVLVATLLVADRIGPGHAPGEVHIRSDDSRSQRQPGRLPSSNAF